MVEKLFELQPMKYGQYNDLEILSYLYERNIVKYVVYGTGEKAEWFIHWAEKVYGFKPAFCIETDSINETLEEYNICSFDEFKLMKEDNLFVVLAVDKECLSEEKRELCDMLKKYGAVTIFNADRLLHPYKLSWYSYIKRNKDKFDKTYEYLHDKTSKDTYLEYLKTYILGKRFEGITFPEEYKYWGIDSEEYRLFTFNENEVLLNVGGYIGDTIFQYIKGEYPFKKIITVEADSLANTYLNRSINLLVDELKDKIQIDKFFLGEGENTIDKRYVDSKISIINMDIEGAELAVLKTGIEVIKKDRPILAICVYHKKEDLIDIPQFIMDNFENYVLELRKYPSCYWNYIDGIQQINELVLYAIPRERYIQRL